MGLSGRNRVHGKLIITIIYFLVILFSRVLRFRQVCGYARRLHVQCAAHRPLSVLTKCPVAGGTVSNGFAVSPCSSVGSTLTLHSFMSLGDLRLQPVLRLFAVILPARSRRYLYPVTAL